MKKLFLQSLLLFICISFSNATFAADIVIKNVRIKKRNVSSLTQNNNDFDLREAILTSKTTADPYSKESNNSTTTQTVVVSFKEASDIYPITIRIRFKSSLIGNPNPVIKETTATPVAGMPKTYTATIAMPSNPNHTSPNLIDVEIDVVNTNGNLLAAFESKEDKKPCDEKFKLSDVDFITSNISGLYIMSFNFSVAPGSEVPASSDMLVQVTNCKGDKATVKVKVDGLNGTYTGTATITQDKDCPWVLTYGEFYGYNPCGDESTWAIDFGQVKTNGTGTRSGAASVKSKPTLK